MLPLVLIEGEFRSLMRNSLERFIGVNLKKQESALKNKYVKVGYKISLRVISSLIAIFIFNYIKTDGSESTLRQIVSYSMIAFFFYVLTLKN